MRYAEGYRQALELIMQQQHTYMGRGTFTPKQLSDAKRACPSVCDKYMLLDMREPFVGYREDWGDETDAGGLGGA